MITGSGEEAVRVAIKIQKRCTLLLCHNRETSLLVIVEHGANTAQRSENGGGGGGGLTLMGHVWRPWGPFVIKDDLSFSQLNTPLW